MSSLILIYCDITLASCSLSSSTTNRINSFFSAFNSSYLSLFCFFFSYNSACFSFLTVLDSSLSLISSSFSFYSLMSMLSRASCKLKFFYSLSLWAFSRAYSRMAYRSCWSKISNMTPSTKTLNYSITPVFSKCDAILRKISSSLFR